MNRLTKILASGDLPALGHYLDEIVGQGIPERRRAVEGRRYYENDNCIRRREPLEEMLDKARLEKNPLRNSDFRISHNWHQLLVNQKASYLFSYPPLFDCGSPGVNARVNKALGEDFPKIVKNLAIDAANTGVGWLHIWLDGNGKFSYAPVPREQIYCVYNSELPAGIAYVIRDYYIEAEDGERKRKIEIWDEKQALFFEKSGKGNLKPVPVQGGTGNCLPHTFNCIPFVPFANNSSKTGDLYMVKDLIDQYDLVVSGFANDLADIQEVIFVLRNYGGEDLNTFLSELKRYKAIKVEGDAMGDGGVETMQIEIPVEARIKFLELLKKQIFISGQGVNPDPQNFGNTSGVALKYLYSLLEIKAGLLETEFRAGFSQFLRILLGYLGLPEDTPIEQIYYRNSIENDMEIAEIAEKSQGIISRRTILRNHPWVEDAAQEAEALAQEGESGGNPA